MNINVIKRNGVKEHLNVEKFHKVIEWACESINGVSVSEIALKARIQLYNNIKTTDIQEILIKTSAELITEENRHYQYVAGRLVSYHIRKEVYGKYEPRNLLHHYNIVMVEGYYDNEICLSYDKDEWEELDRYIEQDRDNLLTYGAMEQFRSKYLVKNRVTGALYETPQMAFMLIAMTLFNKYPKETRMKWVKDYYDAISLFDVSLPTPIMAGVRTPQRQFSSCVLVETDDSLDSINATTSSIVKYVSQKAGIGLGAGRIRAVGSPIRNGDASHTGVVPFYKLFQSAVKSCSQGGVRGGAATLYYPIWHYEIEDLLVLKNNKGTEENRVRHMDYGVQFNRVMYERLIAGGNITLFSPNDVPELYESFFNNTERFAELYQRAERNPKLRKKQIPAIELFSAFMQERKDTGRIYLMNVDHANDHGSFVKETAPIRMSNLCCEIDLPTVPLNDVNGDEGEIALCTLSAINWGKIKKPEDFAKPCELAVRGLDALLDYQDYPVKAGQRSAMKYRPLGIGIINLAYWMASNDMTYSKPNLEKVDQYAEAWSYYLIKASADLAKEQGDIPGHDHVKYSQGILPIDTYKKEVDELVTPNYRMDWEALRIQLWSHGIRNATLMALMPAETSALISNSTNGIEPPRALITIKQSKDGVLKQVVPNIRKLKNKYELLWDQKSPEGYLKICAVLQKYIDQGISVNTSYNPKFYPEEKIPLSDMLQHILMFYKYGGKQLYYFNTNDQSGELEVKELPVTIDDTDCDSCKI